VLNTYAVSEQKQKQWTTDWWKWVLSINETNVLLDQDGTQIMKYQPTDKDVYFLTGAYNSNLTRNVTVPVDKPILLPVLNAIQWCIDCDVLDSFGLRERMIERAGVNNDALHMEAQLNNKTIPYYRITSDLFDLKVIDNNSMYIQNQTGNILPAVSDGYWVILENLKPGTYKVHTNGILKDHSYQTNVHYNLEVITK
jgi:hypothetical protein